MPPEGPPIALPEVVDAARSFELALFARGYLVTVAAPQFVPPEWCARVDDAVRVYTDPRIPVTQAREASAWVACIGLVVDARDATATDGQIVGALARELAATEAAFFDRLSWCNGRFVILYRSGPGPICAVTDATGMKCVFYVEGGGAIASHAALLALATGQSLRRHDFPVGGGWPGTRTPYAGIHLLTPNTRLSLADGGVARFYPVAPRPRLSVDDAAEGAADLLARTMQGFATRSRLVISLTAGLDSRTTLAAARPLASRARFFTYRRGQAPSDVVDGAVARRITERLGLRHEVLDIAEDSATVPPGFRRLCSVNSLIRPDPGLAYAYLQRYAQYGETHVRSNVSEVGRTFYWKRPGTRRVLRRSDQLMRTYLRSLRDAARTEALVAFCTDAFQTFLDRTGFASAIDWIDSRDLFYWEHRLSAWHSQLITESDPSFDTLSPFNCRRLLELLLAPSDEERQTSAVLRAIIRSLWPELAVFPVNPDLLPAPPAAGGSAHRGG